MKRLKRLSSLTTASVLAVSALLNIALVPTAHAAAISWDGGAATNDLSTAANWAGDVLPTADDDVTIALGAIAVDRTFTVSSPLSVNSITFTGNGSSSPDVTVSGQTISVKSGINNNSDGLNLVFSTNVVLTGDTTFRDFSFDTTAEQTVDLNGHNLTITPGDGVVTLNNVSGAGNIAVGGSMAYAYLRGVGTGWTGSLTIAANSYASIYPGSLGSANPINILSGGAICFGGFNGANLASPLTVGGNGTGYGAIYVLPNCGQGGSSGFNSTANIVLTGSVSLTENTLVSGRGELKITGALSGAYTIAQTEGQDGRVVIESSNNTSQTQNGTHTSPQKVTEYTASNPTEYVIVEGNNVAVVKGTYGDTAVYSGGILKGTGTVGMLEVNTGGIVAPGLSPGILNTGDLSLAGTYQFEVGGTTPGTGHDQIKVTGTVGLTGGTLEATLYNGFVPTVGQSYTIIDNDGTDAVTGTFTGIAEGGEYTNQGVTYTVTYAGGDGNDVVLTVTAIDESQLPKAPDTGFMLLVSNPVVTLIAATAAAAGVLIVRNRLQKQPAKRR